MIDLWILARTDFEAASPSPRTVDDRSRCHPRDEPGASTQCTSFVRTAADAVPNSASRGSGSATSTQVPLRALLPAAVKARNDAAARLRLPRPTPRRSEAGKVGGSVWRLYAMNRGAW